MNCTTCTHWNLKRAGRMAQLGFGVCDKGPLWRFHSPVHTCAKHGAAPAPVVAKRVAWLAKQEGAKK